MKIWIDIKNAHEPAFFEPFLNHFGKDNFYITARDYTEIVGLLEKKGIKHITVGGFYGKNLISKVIGRFAIRNSQLQLKVPKFDIGLSHMSMESAWVSKFRFKPVISFTDNDLEQKYAKAQLPIIDYLIIPSVIPEENFRKMGSRKNIIKFDGYKEDIYIADFKPDPKFLDNLPFYDFVTLRPEALKAEYVPNNAKSIVPQLLKLLNKKNINVLYLPRYKEDYNFANGYKNVFIPPEPLNGLDVCYYSKAMLTGSGTFAREAALLGKPAICFYPGKELLTVDKELIKKGWIMHSRDPIEIVELVKDPKDRKNDIERSIKVKKEAIKIIEEILNEI